MKINYAPGGCCCGDGRSSSSRSTYIPLVGGCTFCDSGMPASLNVKIETFLSPLDGTIYTWQGLEYVVPYFGSFNSVCVYRATLPRTNGTYANDGKPLSIEVIYYGQITDPNYFPNNLPYTASVGIGGVIIPSGFGYVAGASAGSTDFSCNGIGTFWYTTLSFVPYTLLVKITPVSDGGIGGELIG